MQITQSSGYFSPIVMCQNRRDIQGSEDLANEEIPKLSGRRSDQKSNLPCSENAKKIVFNRLHILVAREDSHLKRTEESTLPRERNVLSAEAWSLPGSEEMDWSYFLFFLSRILLIACPTAKMKGKMPNKRGSCKEKCDDCHSGQTFSPRSSDRNTKETHNSR